MQSDVVEYRVYRQYLDGEPELLGAMKTNETNFVDKSAKLDVSAFYCVACVNKYGAESVLEDWMRVGSEK